MLTVKAAAEKNKEKVGRGMKIGLKRVYVHCQSMWTDGDGVVATMMHECGHPHLM